MIKISADSTCDLSVEITEQLGISIAPLNIVVEEKVYQDGIDIFPIDVVRFVDEKGMTCRTAAININEYHQHFESLLEESEGVVHVCLSSAFSSCYQNAMISAESFDNVHIVDSRNLSTGSGQLVYEGAYLAKLGKEAEEIIDNMEKSKSKIDASFVIDRLDYLAKGGRCSSLTAQSAKLLKIKPSIQVHNGEMQVGKKYRGSFQRCIQNYVKDRLKQLDRFDSERVFITHCLCPEEIVQMVKEMIESLDYFKEVHITTTGSTIASHCGPKTLGIGLKKS